MIAGWLRDHDEVSARDRASLKELFGWFNAMLERPVRFNQSRGPNRNCKAPSWFKDSADEHVKRVRQTVDVAEKYGYSIRTIRRSRPGYLVYQDEFQLAAEPFADTMK